MIINQLRLKGLDDLLRGEVDAGRLPGFTLAIGLGDEIVHQNSGGYAENLNGIIRKMESDTIFDLASLTKVVATLPSVLLLIDRGQIRLNDPVFAFIPEFANASKSEVTIRHLLTHTSGLPAERKFYKFCNTRADIIRMVKNEELEMAPGTKVKYSDLGFILLGEVIKTVTGTELNHYVREQIFEPLGMKETQYTPSPELRSRIAATEEFSGIGAKVGIVHDENTLAMEGVSGHAGLFAPISDIIRYVQMWLHPPTSLLSEAVRDLAVRSHTSSLDGRRGLGWTYRGDAYDHMGDLWPTTAIGHTGFTGTSIALDPRSKLWTILLTNDVHYGRENRTIGALRARVHNMIGAALIGL